VASHRARLDNGSHEQRLILELAGNVKGRRALLRRMRGWLGSPTWAAAHFRTAGELKALVERAGLSVRVVRGAVYFPPIGAVARALAPVDSWLGRLTTCGAAFIAVAATRRA
jgi:hypothetical protein